MKIGIIADLHDNLRHLEIVRQELLGHNVELLLFCGDFDMPFSMRGFIDFNIPIKAVLGNGDPDIQKFQYQLQNLQVLKSLDLDIGLRFQDITVDGRRIAISHGDDEALNKVIIESQLFDVFCLGHNHVPRINQEGKTTIINPGSLVGWFYEQPGRLVPVTYSIYNTTTGTAELYEAKL
ncbi:MAG: YfcE family phosphodiesterase [Patescibacteria group bacterium]|jgi:hypothetical protein